MEAKVKGAYPCYDWFDVSVQSLHNISCSYHGDLCPLPKHPANTGNEGIMNNHYPLIRLGIAPHLQHIPHLSRWSRTAAPEWSTCLILELALPSSLQPHWQSSWVVGRKPPVTQVSLFHKVGYRFPLIHVSPPFVCVKGDDETSQGTGTLFAKKRSDSGGFHSYCCWITIKADSPYLLSMWILPKGISSDEDFKLKYSCYSNMIPFLLSPMLS